MKWRHEGRKRSPTVAAVTQCVATVTLVAAEATRHAQRGAEIWRAGDVNPLIAILRFLRFHVF